MQLELIWNIISFILGMVLKCLWDYCFQSKKNAKEMEHQKEEREKHILLKEIKKSLDRFQAAFIKVGSDSWTSDSKMIEQSVGRYNAIPFSDTGLPEISILELDAWNTQKLQEWIHCWKDINNRLGQLPGNRQALSMVFAHEPKKTEDMKELYSFVKQIVSQIK